MVRIKKYLLNEFSVLIHFPFGYGIDFYEDRQDLRGYNRDSGRIEFSVKNKATVKL